MKPIRLLLFLLAMTSLGCSNEETETPKNDSSLNKSRANMGKEIRDGFAPLTGTWTWTYTSGGFTGIPQTPASTGRTQKIIFSPNSSYRIYHNDVMTMQGTYTITYARCIHNFAMRPVVNFSNWFMWGLMISSISPHNLELEEEFPDGVGRSYVRN